MHFERGIKGPADAQYPEVDNYGFRGRIAGLENISSQGLACAALSLSENSQGTINLVRDNIGLQAPLFVISTEPNLLEVVSANPCKPAPTVPIQLRTKSTQGKHMLQCNLQVRFGSESGPVIANLLVCVMQSLIVKIQPHIVQIDSKTGNAGEIPHLEMQSLFKQVQAIWHHAGIHLLLAKPTAIKANLHQANLMACNAELNEMNQITSLRWEAERINIYFLQCVEGNKDYCINAQAHKLIGLNHPGIFVPLNINTHARTLDVNQFSNNIAHAIGQFFSLKTLKGAASMADTWSMGNLMYPQNPVVITNNENKTLVPKDLGYGLNAQEQAYRGAFIPLKTPMNVQTSGPLIAARRYISKGFKYLYS